MMEKVLDVRDLSIHYRTPQGHVKAVNDVSFDVERGEVLGLIGESGCGKTSAAMTVLRLLPPTARITAGSIVLNGQVDLVSLSEAELRKYRWKELALVPQGAMNSLNPVMKVRNQLVDGITAHDRSIGDEEIRQRSKDLFGLVGLPRRTLDLYPHELSGGMKQRVCIALALVNHPALIVADEPTSALDVNVQRLVAQTLTDIKQEMGTSMIVIGHDMGLMAQLADRVAVMYAGSIMEIGPVDEVLRRPQHPYTKLLMDSVPEIGHDIKVLNVEGITHDLRNPPTGCAFQDRCPMVVERCRQPFAAIASGARHGVACVRLGEIDVTDMWKSVEL